MIDYKNLPGVKFTHLTYARKSAENNAWDEYNKNGRKPIQWLVDKFCKNRCWKRLGAKWDFAKKAVRITILANVDEAKDVDVSYEEICKEMKWKSFKLLGTSSVVPVEMTMDEVSELYSGVVKKTLSKDKKWLKEHPEAASELKGPDKDSDKAEN